MKKPFSLFKNFYLLTIIFIFVFCVITGKFLKAYLYDTLTNSQIISLFKDQISLPNVTALEDISAKIEKKMADDKIEWEKIRNPFGKTIPKNSENNDAEKKITVVN